MMRNDKKTNERKTSSRPSRATGSGVVSEIALDNHPLLDRPRELQLGHSIQRGLRRLARLLARHPSGYRRIVERMTEASLGKVRVTTWCADRDQLTRDGGRAREHLAAFESSDNSLEKRVRHFEHGVAILSRYPLEPEFALQLGTELARASHRNLLRHRRSFPGLRQRLRSDPHSAEEAQLPSDRNVRPRQLGLTLARTRPTAPRDDSSEKSGLGDSGAASSTCIRRLEKLIGRVIALLTRDRDVLTGSNERLVLREALKYRPRGLKASDLYQEGFIGLQRAALRFDASRNLRFSTYATFWVRQAIRQSLINQSRLIRVPQRAQLQLRKWQAGAESRLDEAEAERVSRVMHRTVTFSFVQDEDESLTEFDRSLWESGPSFAPGSLPTIIEDGLKRLSERERRIVQRRFGLDGRPSQTLESIGREMDLSRERVRQLEREAMRRLRRNGQFEDAYESVLSAS